MDQEHYSSFDQTEGSGTFPRVMWGGGIWFGSQLKEARDFAIWLLDKGYIVGLVTAREEVVFYTVPNDPTPQVNFHRLKQRLLDEWQQRA